MKLITLAIILALIFGLIYYTADTFDVVQIVGKHSIAFVVHVYKDLKEKSDKGEFNDVLEDIQKKS